MSNPYKTPLHSHSTRGLDPKSEIRGPAIALIIVSSIALGLGVLGLASDFYLLNSGAVAKLEEFDFSAVHTMDQAAIRFVWGLILLVASLVVLFGAIQMKNLKNYVMARDAAIVAIIPCLGPCCLLGIPFGIWALTVLGKQEVRDAFEES